MAGNILRGRFRYPFAIHGATATLWDRFWAKVDMSGGPEACWTWNGSKRRRRRGRRGKMQVGGRGSRYISADRLALALHTDGNLTRKQHGALLQCCHRCGNGDDPIQCVNPHHEYWGTQKQNERDKKRKAARDITASIAEARNDVGLHGHEKRDPVLAAGASLVTQAALQANAPTGPRA